MFKNGSVYLTLALMLFVTFAAAFSAVAQEETELFVNNDGQPEPNVGVVVSTENSRTNVGTTGATGGLPFPASLLTGKVRAEVYVQSCEDGSKTLILVPDGSQLNAADESCQSESGDGETSCGCRRLGAFYWPFTDGISLGGSGFPVKPVVIGSAIAGGSILLLTNGDGMSTPSTPSAGPVVITTNTDPNPGAVYDPSGFYPSTIIVIFDPSGHICCIIMPDGMVLDVKVNGNTITITGVHPFVPVMGPFQHPFKALGSFDARTGSFNATGSGTVAGFSNIAVRFEGTITEAGALSGTYMMGTGGGLPGGQPITYEIKGQKQ